VLRAPLDTAQLFVDGALSGTADWQRLGDEQNVQFINVQ
jgi:hypothetical protein